MTDPIFTEELTPYIAPLFDRKPKAVTAIDVRTMTSYTDVVVVVEAGSNRQATALAEHIIKTLKGLKIQAVGAEGVKPGEWALLDYGHIVIHIFESQAKEFYDLEGLWSDAPRIDLSQFGALENDMDDDGY